MEEVSARMPLERRFAQNANSENFPQTWNLSSVSFRGKGRVVLDQVRPNYNDIVLDNSAKQQLKPGRVPKKPKNC
jgi:hypothetical protein